MLEDGLLARGIDEIEALLCGALLRWRDWLGSGVQGTIEPCDIGVLQPKSKRE